MGDDITQPAVPEGIVDSNIHEMITAINQETHAPERPVAKLHAHVNNIPHQAISVFIFRDDKLLLQQRARTKYHSGGLWANTVCSHPRWQETALQCAERRIAEELGEVATALCLRACGDIRYAARVGALYENEQVTCFAGRDAAGLDWNRFNPDEVQSVRWASIPEILDAIERTPERFTEWFKIYMRQHLPLMQRMPGFTGSAAV